MAAATIEEYIESLSGEAQRVVREFADYIGERYPQLRGIISFSMPMWLAGKKLREGYVAISAASRHFSIHFSDEAFVWKLGNRLPRCPTGKRCVNIRYGDDASFEIVKESLAAFFPGQKKG